MKGKGGGFFNPVNEGQGNNRNYSNGDKRYNNNNKNTDVQVMFLGKTTMATKKKITTKSRNGNLRHVP